MTPDVFMISMTKIDFDVDVIGTRVESALMSGDAEIAVTPSVRSYYGLFELSKETDIEDAPTLEQAQSGK